MAQATFYIDTASFSTATAVFSDRALQTKAADGYYSDEIIVRRQVSGVLEPAVNCPNCGSPPPTPTEYCVSQFPVNQITLDTGAAAVEGVDFTLTGDTTNPTIKCGIPGAVVSFNILASPASGKQFRASDPFNGSINGDDIVIPNSNINVNNILTGVIEDIPVTTPATQYIFLGACQNGSIFELNYSGQDGLFLEVTDAELTTLNAAAGNQRYSVTGQYGAVSFFFYNKNDKRNNPTKTTLTQTEKNRLSGTGSGYYGILSPIKVAGEFDCPAIIPKEFGVFRMCEPTSSDDPVVCMELTQQLTDSLTLADVGVRYADSSGKTYVLEQRRDTASSDPLVTGLLPVNVRGVRFQGGFSFTPAQGCPEDVYLVQSCTDIYGDGIRKYALNKGVSNWPSPEFDIGTLFQISSGVCFEIFKRVSELEGLNYNTYGIRQSDKIAEGGCGECP
tara:strand:+ start:4954 stop:6294 length:1341 start_codon:yes stop_codon:yes gene_type:complete